MDNLELTRQYAILRIYKGANDGIVIALNIAIAVIVSGATIARYVFVKDLRGYEEILIPMAFWLYMFGGVNGSIEKSQITADILFQVMKDNIRKDLMCLLRDLVTAIMSGIFMAWAYKSVIYFIDLGQQSLVWGVPIWIAYAAIFYGMLVMTVFHVIYLISSAKQFYLRRIR